MSKAFFRVHHSCLGLLENLSDEESGRLFRAALSYSKDGILTELRGNEKYIFPAIRAQIDDDRKSNPTPPNKGAGTKTEIRAIWNKYHFSPPLEQSVKAWGTYKAERGQRYQPTGLNSLFSQIKKHADAHGDTAVIELIEHCMSNNWKGIIWDKLGQKVTASGGTARRVEKSVRPVAPAGNAEWDAVARLLQTESEDIS